MLCQGNDTVICYTESDRTAFYHQLAAAGVTFPFFDTIVLQPIINRIQKEPGAGLFEAGYYGFCCLDAPTMDIITTSTRLEQFAYQWMCDLAHLALISKVDV